MQQIKQGPNVVGIASRLRIEKSKLAPPSRQADVNLFFDGRGEEAEGGHGRVGES